MADRLLEEATRAADKLHGDTSVPMSKTIDRLTDLRDHVNMLIESCGEPEEER